ncbi:protein-export chaperone SecB [Deferrisoma camini]|uniref:protein-export chaperone SecB n=1 Tax=Deferrisoma camini TaxID=1035120 RepID=UPI00046D86D3|nr:protein-export chaperone SecB [Deferrisoma camini]
MKAPPLRLENYFFPRVLVEANPNFANTDTNQEVPIKLSAQPQVSVNTKDPLRFRLILKIRVAYDEDHPSPYGIELDAVGFFRVDETVPEDQRTTLVHVNGSTILFAAAREFLLGVTGRGPWGNVMLPAWSFHPGVHMEEPPKEGLAEEESIPDQSG